MLRALIAAAALLFPTAAPAQTPPAPRDTVGAIATQIRDLYFSAERGDAIADALEAEAAEGRYDSLTDPRDLAATLSARLAPEDAHFSVVYDPEGVGQRGAPTRGPGPGSAPRGPDPQRLSNYGFVGADVLPGNVGLIEMRFFADIDFDDANDPARRAADAAMDLVANADAVIFDLRNNGGGAPSMVGYLSSAFTPADADIYNTFHSREGTQREAPAIFHPQPRLDVPVYILISARTGSAAEALPYTLQAAGRATIVGEASGGAANPGGQIPVPGGFSVFVSGGSPVNPITRTNWEGAGVQPDLDVPAAEALTHARVAALESIIRADPARTDAVWALEAVELSAGPDHIRDYAAYVGTYGPLELAVHDGALEVRRGRRPPLVLSPVSDDVFFVVSDPLVRVSFERDASGRIIAVEQRSPFGPGSRQRRQ